MSEQNEVVIVNVENFRRVETNRMFFGMDRNAGGVNRFNHEYQPIAIDQQNVIRMNRDTLYSGAVVNITHDVPVDGFWSVTVYNKDGFLEKNEQDAYNINNINGVRNEDGSITVHLGGCGDGRPNCLPITEGWNYAVRMYLPRAAILDGTWKFPAVEPCS